jgi:hypothetical protein
MKKIALILGLLSFFACKKDPIDTILNDLDPIDLPQNLVGKWRWIQSSGGFVGLTIKDTARRQILSIEVNKRYQTCINDTCLTNKWAYGSRVLKSSNNTTTKDTVLMLKTAGLLGIQMVFNAKNVKDTMIVRDDCDDCFSHLYVKVK